MLAHRDGLPEFEASSLLTQARPELLPVLLVLVPAGLYLYGVRRLSARGDRWSPGRTLSFVGGGLGTIAFATMSGLAAYDESLFSVHMVQHMLLSMVATVFLALGAPVTLALRLTLNMFAGHLVLVLFVLGGEYLLLEYGGIVGILAGSVSIFASIVVTFFEAFIQLLQAYVFTLLAALYIGGALVDEH